MCGIMGYIGKKACISLIYDGLKKLEYRGYDSSGIAVVDGEKISLIKSEGKLTKLKPMLSSLPQDSRVGMGHTRWATHGAPSTKNAHPHLEQGVAIIHNGILENYQELKIELLEAGVKFISDTDSEVVVHLLNQELSVVPDVRKAILNLIPRFKGAYALGIVTVQDPNSIYLVKQGSPLVIGVGDGENFFASDALALVEHTKKILFLEDGELACLTKDKVQVWNFNGGEIQSKITEIEWTASAAEKGGHRHYMIKEIHEQGVVLAQTIERMSNRFKNTFNTKELGLDDLDLPKIQRILITGCGTAYYAGMTGKYKLEELIGLPIEIELASELRYRTPYIDEHTLLIAMTQSGETADTLACVKMAKKAGAQILAVCNVRFSSIPRESKSALYMDAGPEIGVASTKAFTSMMLNLYIFALAYAEIRKPNSNIQKTVTQLNRLPTLITQALSQEAYINQVAKKYFESSNCIFIGRGLNYPIALEGALKLKEISYIHAEGYAGGELKHGPIALIDTHMPVVAIVPKDRHHDKMMSNIEEVCARDGRVLGIGSGEDQKLRSLCEDYIPCPDIEDDLLQALLAVIPLQLFAYHVALMRGTDVDQPRNLAKSVTVE